uniref:TIR domain-containing protein n=1 Tax=Neogobius melanostomus TaxID=47308 RepID=A0A8C6V903_9GOBI
CLSQMEPLFSLLFLLLLPRSSWLYSLHNCSIESIDPQIINCNGIAMAMTLSSIPSDIPKSAVSLDISSNKIRSIQQNDFSGFTELQMLNLGENNISHIEDLILSENRLSNLTVLDLSKNQITNISEFAFVPLTNLQVLRLQHNHLSSISDIVNIVSLCPLLNLVLSGNNLTSFESDKFPLNITFLDLSMTPLSRFSLHSDVFPHLQTLDLSNIHNDLQWDVSDKAFLQSLRTLHLSSTNFTGETYQLIFQSLDLLENLHLRGVDRLDRGLLDWACGIENLQRLDLSSNYILVLYDSFLLPCSNLTKLDLSQNSLSKLGTSSLQMLTRLSRLNLGNNLLTKVPRTIRNISSLTTLSLFRNKISNLLCLDFSGLHLLKVLDLSMNELRDLNSCVFTLPSLQRLKITKIDPSCSRWPQDILQGSDALEELSLWLSVCESPDSKMFRHMPHLSNLEIKGGKNWLPVPELFKPLTVLKTLVLYLNGLKSVDFLSEANLTQLQTLSLHSNDLSVINERVFEALPSLRYLNLWDNPFACDCSNAGFIDWVIRNTQIYVDGAFDYTCTSPESHRGKLLLEFDYRWCWESVGLFCFLCSSALVLLTLFLTFLHHFLRFHLLYGFYLLRAFLYHRQQRGRGCAEIYDAFVSYNVHDEEWVYRELLPELEGRQGWKLCLHHRDFEPGKAIMENIVDAIYSSRKTLCVISHQYLLSEWCSREIQMARCCSSSHTLSLVIGEVHFSHKRIKLWKLMRSRTYLSWSGARATGGCSGRGSATRCSLGPSCPQTTHCPLTTDPLQTTHCPLTTDPLQTTHCPLTTDPLQTTHCPLTTDPLQTTHCPLTTDPLQTTHCPLTTDPLQTTHCPLTTDPLQTTHCPLTTDPLQTTHCPLTTDPLQTTH